MTYLELCQDFMREAGIPGTLASVQGQVGESLRAVNWIAKAYRSIQTEHADWEFLRNDVEFETNASNSMYSAAAAGVTGFGSWRWRGSDWRAFLASSGPIDEQPLSFIAYDNFRRIYGYGAQRMSTGRPIVVTERPDQSLQMWPIPSDTYTIVGEQYAAPLILVNNGDTPVFDAQFHDVIVWRALQLYGAFEGDSAVFTYGQAECARVLALMEEKYLPKWQASRPMA